MKRSRFSEEQIVGVLCYRLVFHFSNLVSSSVKSRINLHWSASERKNFDVSILRTSLTNNRRLITASPITIEIRLHEMGLAGTNLCTASDATNVMAMRTITINTT